jgi:hypothetical protein
MNMSNPFDQADDFFGGGTPGISFKGEANRGVWKGGQLVKIGERQQSKDFKTKELEYWDEEKTQPKMVLPLTLATTERDPLNPHDDGQRTLWVGASTALQWAIAEAIKATSTKLRPGGTLYVQWTGGAGEVGDPKQYTAHWTPPVPGAAAADAMFAQQSAPAAPAAPAAPVAPVAPPVAAPVAPPVAPPAAAVPPPAPPVAPVAPPPAAPVAPPVAPPPAAPVAPAGPSPELVAAYARLTPEQLAAAQAGGLGLDQIKAVFPAAFAV